MGNTSGLVRVRVRAQGKTVIPGELTTKLVATLYGFVSKKDFSEGIEAWVAVGWSVWSAATATIVWVLGGGLSRPNILITPLARAVLTHKSGAHEANKGQINLYEY